VALSCDCGYGDYDWYYEITELNYSANSQGICYGCRKQIQVGELVAHIEEYNYDEEGERIEESVIGRICETCWDMNENLDNLGFCITCEGMGFIKEAMKDYRTDYVNS